MITHTPESAARYLMSTLPANPAHEDGSERTEAIKALAPVADGYLTTGQMEIMADTAGVAFGMVATGSALLGVVVGTLAARLLRH